MPPIFAAVSSLSKRRRVVFSAPKAVTVRMPMMDSSATLDLEAVRQKLKGARTLGAPGIATRSNVRYERGSWPYY